MNFLSMDYFLMTAEKRSFTKAADALHITQQTLSTHIANLEQELDCKLFVRHVPLELTYAGEIFWQYAADFQKKYRAMQHEFADLTKSASPLPAATPSCPRSSRNTNAATRIWRSRSSKMRTLDYKKT